MRSASDPPALNNLAWELATSPDAGDRDGALAVKLAERACELTHYQTAIFVGTLAAAYAEAGRFDEAVATAQKACALASEKAEQPEPVEGNQELLVFVSSPPAIPRTHQDKFPVRIQASLPGSCWKTFFQFQPRDLDSYGKNCRGTTQGVLDSLPRPLQSSFFLLWTRLIHWVKKYSVASPSQPDEKKLSGQSSADNRTSDVASGRAALSPWLLAVLLGLVTIALYWPSLNDGFTNYDDDVYVTSNVHVQNGLTLEDIKWAFSIRVRQLAPLDAYCLTCWTASFSG